MCVMCEGGKEVCTHEAGGIVRDVCSPDRSVYGIGNPVYLAQPYYLICALNFPVPCTPSGPDRQGFILHQIWCYEVVADGWPVVQIGHVWSHLFGLLLELHHFIAPGYRTAVTTHL